MSTVVARVNDKEITAAEVEEMAAAYQQQTGKPEITEDDKKMLVDNLIDIRLMQEEAIARELEVSDEMFDQQMQRFYMQYGGEENVLEMFKAQNVDIEVVKENIRADLMGQLTAKDELDAKLNVTDEDLQDFYDKNKASIKTGDTFKASHILIKNEEENAKEKAEGLLSQINDGADFAELAKENSACPSGQKGGDLGEFGRGQMVPEFEYAVSTLAVDEVSNLVETQFGFHIIKKTGETAGRELTFEEAKAQINEIITKEKSGDIIKELLTSLRDKHTVEYAS